MASHNSVSNYSVKKYGISDAKKVMLDNLAKEAADANYEVEKYQAKVTSLTSKAEKCRLLLTDAELMRSKTKDNKELLNQLMQQAVELQSQSGIANKEMKRATEKTTTLFSELNIVMQKLIYAASLVNKLFNFVTRQKALNPLISDELVNRINTAVTDANNAVALTLVALKASYSAYAMNIESGTVVTLTQKLSEGFYNSLTGNAAVSTVALFNEMCLHAEANYVIAKNKSVESTNQLNEALLQLNTVQIKLKSLQSGLAAGNAAGLAS